MQLKIFKGSINNLSVVEPASQGRVNLNDTEIAVLVLLLRKQLEEGAVGATADEVSREVGLSLQHAYKVLRDLSLKGFVTYAKASSLSVFGVAVAAGTARKVIYMPIKERIAEHRDEILEWARRIGHADKVESILSKLTGKTRG